MNEKSRSRMPMRGVVFALSSSILFGLTTPFAKSLLQDIKPVLLAGLFYLGSGFGLTIYLLATSKAWFVTEASLTRKDLPWLGGAVAAGGVIAPVLLMCGLAVTRASTASLFLNLESVLTAMIAWSVFKENFDKRILFGMMAIVLGGILLTIDTSNKFVFTTGLWLISGACFCWALDNNLTRKVSAANPAQIACLKGLVAGIINVALAVLVGANLPSFASILEIMIIGFLGYGVSLVLFVFALRYIGTARTGAYFAVAPFFGALVSIIFLKEPVSTQFIAASILMGIGLWLHLTEDHSHQHEHYEIEHEHEHEHVHDDHHLHAHSQNDPVGERHVHLHKHDTLMHTHPHFPDLHHSHH